MSKIFSERLKAYRKELSIKRNEKVGQVKLALELGVSKGNIGDLECGNRMPSKKLLLKLAEHSGKSLDYWMDGIEEYEAPDTVALVIETMIANGMITSTVLSKDAQNIINDAVLIEIERRLK